MCHGFERGGDGPAIHLPLPRGGAAAGFGSLHQRKMLLNPVAEAESCYPLRAACAPWGTAGPGAATGATAPPGRWTMYEDLALYIDGEWCQGSTGDSEEVITPATEKVLGVLPHASPADLDRARR